MTTQPPTQHDGGPERLARPTRPPKLAPADIDFGEIVSPARASTAPPPTASDAPFAWCVFPTPDGGLSARGRELAVEVDDARAALEAASPTVLASVTAAVTRLRVTLSSRDDEAALLQSGLAARAVTSAIRAGARTETASKAIAAEVPALWPAFLAMIGLRLSPRAARAAVERVLLRGLGRWRRRLAIEPTAALAARFAELVRVGVVTPEAIELRYAFEAAHPIGPADVAFGQLPALALSPPTVRRLASNESAQLWERHLADLIGAAFPGDFVDPMRGEREAVNCEFRERMIISDGPGQRGALEKHAAVTAKLDKATHAALEEWSISVAGVRSTIAGAIDRALETSPPAIARFGLRHLARAVRGQTVPPVPTPELAIELVELGGVALEDGGGR